MVKRDQNGIIFEDAHDLCDRLQVRENALTDRQSHHVSIVYPESIAWISQSLFEIEQLEIQSGDESRERQLVQRMEVGDDASTSARIELRAEKGKSRAGLSFFRSSR